MGETRKIDHVRVSEHISPHYKTTNRYNHAMKALLAIAVSAALTTAFAHARIGETQDEISKRYGAGNKTGDTRLPGTERFTYTKDNFYVEVMFSAGKSVMEVFHRNDATITDDDIKGFLNVNADGHGWAIDKKTNHWRRGDYMLQAFREPGHDDFFFIQDVTAVRESEKKGKAKPSGF